VARFKRDTGWEPMFWTVFKESRNAMTLLDAGRRHVEVNGALLHLTGYGRKELIGRPVWMLNARDRATEEDWVKWLTGDDFTANAVLRRADGSEMKLQYAAHPAFVDGERYMLVVGIHTGAAGRPRSTATHPGEGQPLSAREREIVHLVSLGRSSPEIADELLISNDTVRTHVRNAMGKVGARSRAQLVAMALGDEHIR
jgi:PAS domain S-box-containing protein